MEKKDTYHLAIDGMRILAILAVVCIHSTTRLLEASNFNLDSYNLTLFLNQASRFAVPLFFMISGFVLEVNFPFHQSYLSYFKKRLSKIFIPYLFWSGIYYFFVYKQHAMPFLQTLLDGSSSYQLYFIPTLLIFYLVFPFVHTIYKYIANKWVLLILGILQVILLLKDYYIHPLPFFYPITIALLNYYIFLLGMVAAHHHARIFAFVGKWKIAVIFLLAFLSGLIFVQGKMLYLQSHNYLFFYSSWRPSILFYTLTIFGVSYFFFNTLTKHEKVIRMLSRLSFFVFFIHVVVLETVWTLFGKNLFQATLHFPQQELWLDPFFFITIAIISCTIAYVAHKIPYMAKITG